ncbi:hypothetical protein [Streptomyces sp. NPDC046870]|uniref:hypothetical protein n=1 Tax=Streptomyces sp. NPDC046870 TaxID=3155135 RepID=UPI0034558ABA
MPAVVALVLAALSGCSQEGPCAGYDVVSGVGVMFDRKGYVDLAGGSYELCARGECVRGELPRRERITHVSLPLPHDVDPDSGPVRFRVTRQGEIRPMIDASVDVRLIRQTDGCGSSAYNRGLAFSKEQGLATRVPKAVGDAWSRQVGSQATVDPDPPSE